MAITQAMCNSFKVDILSGGHNFNTTNVARTVNTQDTFRVGLYVTATASLSATTSAYTTTGEVANGSGYTNTGTQATSGQALTIVQVPTNGGSPTTTAYIDFTDSSWTTATFSAGGALIWNSFNAGKTVAVLDFSGDKSVTAGTFTIQYPAPGTGSSIIQIA